MTRTSKNGDDPRGSRLRRELPSEQGAIIGSIVLGVGTIGFVVLFLFVGGYIPQSKATGNPEQVAQVPQPRIPVEQDPVQPPRDRVEQPNKDRREPPVVNKDKRERPPPPPPPVIHPFDVAVPDGVLAPPPMDIDNLRVTRFRLQAGELLPCLCWADDGNSFYCIEKSTGTLHHIALDGYKELASKSLGVECVWLSRSAEGFLVSSLRPTQITLVDIASLKPIKTYTMPDDFRAVSTPKLSFAYVGSHKDQPVAKGFAVLDLKKDKYVAQYLPQQFPKSVGFHKPIVSPDGNYLLTAGGSGGIYRYRIDGARLTFDQGCGDIVHGCRCNYEVCISPDSKWVSMPVSVGNERGPITYVFGMTNLNAPLLRLSQGNPCETIAFDPPGQMIYAPSDEGPLVIFNYQGSKVKAYKFVKEGETTRFILPHPDGRKLLVLADRGLYYVEVTR
jgi:hypothetical protein